METKNLGNIGESIAIMEFTKREIPVLMPFGDNLPYDLVIELSGEFKKIQVKTTENEYTEGVMRFQTSSKRVNGKEAYTTEEVDYIFLYCLENGFIGIMIPNGKKEIMIRRIPTKNNQKIGINFAEDFDIDKIIGAVMDSTG